MKPIRSFIISGTLAVSLISHHANAMHNIDEDFIKNSCQQITTSMDAEDFTALLANPAQSHTMLLDDIRNQFPKAKDELEEFKKKINAFELNAAGEFGALLSMSIENNFRGNEAKRSLLQFSQKTGMLGNLSTMNLDATAHMNNYTFNYSTGLGVLKLLIGNFQGYYEISNGLSKSPSANSSELIDFREKYLEKYMTYTGDLPVIDLIQIGISRAIKDVVSLPNEVARDQHMRIGQAFLDQVSGRVEVKLESYLNPSVIQNARNGHFPRFGSKDRVNLDAKRQQLDGNFEKAYRGFVVAKHEDYYHAIIEGQLRIQRFRRDSDGYKRDYREDMQRIFDISQSLATRLAQLLGGNSPESQEEYRTSLIQDSYLMREVPMALADDNFYFWQEMGFRRALRD
jgi:hypothetical protein